ncbi:hypothetical protein KB236_03330 [Levilactobacillus brevis]|uniref:Uncharacterized protein n=1 Tax=Levilactobacillus hammesii TaxID=267633 RepID=A0A921JVT2_9LACO|nr:hypothetical protein KB236_03330 [Levilactobacillus brevis]HJE86501.1 hypothetical protein [Levilactobacillus hammesii]
MTQQLTADELRALIKQTAAYRNAQAILANEWGSRAMENPLFQAPITVADLRFAQDLQEAGVSKVKLDFTDYGAVQRWIAANQQFLTADDRAWLQRPFE